ncbi:predicted protein [Sclerotinia sclerotiorum 1980 UF-70]|uniref:BTB domain-containing protein n=2 Tax=Sclerotinia sclerotiorum (strain ATCC 18683 / 1980 / Ss-1) TaxID=665079 RepID=A7F2F5_SCLS1|nr:predicted protein [Sclerotinia sclerotiorum 1980 UF-70]APA09314.1 hypothetical protein sscle_05g040840 [Sclerotinia sclerotiorum 1980 UF-70]EDN95897.1 predicted protein [Sclerotinia sclerotiorum 1980 UF-70]
MTTNAPVLNPPDSNDSLNELLGQSASAQVSLPAIVSAIQELAASMDPESIAEIAEHIELHYRTFSRQRLLHSILRLSRVLRTQPWDAPEQPSGSGRFLMKREGFFDIYNQEGNNKIVTINVGSENQQVKFTATTGILSAQASFFKPLCGDRWKCGRESTMTLSEHSAESFEILLSWLYTKDIKNASCLIKIHPIKREISNIFFRKQSHKSRWFQLLNCYFLADYICAPKFSNYIIDALVFAYKEWSEADFGKIVREPIFDDVEKTRELVEINTPENSPLRSLIEDIVMPRMELKKALTVDEKSSRMPFRIRRGRVVLSDDSIPKRLLQNGQPYNGGTAISSIIQPGHSSLGQPILNHLPFDPSQFHQPQPQSTFWEPINNHHHGFFLQQEPQPQPQVSQSTFWEPPDLHHNHHNTFPTQSQSQSAQPLQPLQTSQPRPHRLSRFIKGITRRTGNDRDKDNYYSNSKETQAGFHKSGKVIKVWEEERCRYHVHEPGRDCRDEV